jgi:pSer/pThr/pTyr-binding forkhead associated (FHA) protein
MPVTVLVLQATPSGGQPGASAKGLSKEGPSLTFEGPRIVIGRGSGSDVPLPDPSISVRHATIRATGSEYAIVDEGSTNGTWVGGVRLLPQTPRLVKSGDLVRVGRVWLEISIGQRAPTPDLGLATRDLALALVKNAMDAVGDDTVAKVRVAEGADIGAELRLVDEGRVYLIGRADRCDLPLADEDASREHASVARRGGQVMIRDLGSRNGVFLGDTRLTDGRDVVWKPPLMARIGRSVLALDEPVSVALAELEAAEDEELREEDAPPAPPSRALPPSAPASDEPPASRMSDAPQAPIAQIVPVSAIPRKPRRTWTIADVLVVTIALAVIGASVAGLVWVLR